MMVMPAIRTMAALTVAAVFLAGADPWSSADVLQPAELASRLSKPSPPAVFHVGFGVLYRSKHIPG